MSSRFTDSAERCTDPIDEASKTETLTRDNDIALARAKAAPEQAQLKDADGMLYWPITECIDCDETIPLGRLALARVRCIICQGILEKRSKQHG